MATVPESARCVVIGAGIVGNSLVYHLAKLGWRDIVQIDKGALPNPGGSTGHASNFIFPVDHSREITDLTLDSVAQYKEMGVFTESGGIEVARTEERMEELRRRMSSAKDWGIESRLVTPEEVAELVPFLDPSVIIGGFYTPSVGVVDSLRAGTIMRERALELGALTVVPTVEVTGLDVEEGRITRVRTSWRRHRGRDRRHRLRRVEPAPRRDGRRAHPADPRRAPDDQRRPGPRARRAGGRDLLPDRARHGHVLLRAPARRRHGGRLLRAPADPARPGGDPLDRAGAAVADRDAVHLRRLRPPARAGSRADAGDPRRRERGDPLRDQRPAVADPRRRPGPRRDARGQGPLVRRRGVDQGGSRRRPRGRRVDDRRSPRDRPRPLRHRAVLPAPADPLAHPRPHRRGLQQDLRDHPPRRAVGQRPRAAAAAGVRVGEGAGRGLLRDRRLGAAVVVRVERRPPRGVRRPGDAARARVGQPLVVADHQRRAPRDARPCRHRRPDRVLDLRRRRPRLARRRAADHRRAGRRRPSAA